MRHVKRYGAAFLAGLAFSLIGHAVGLDEFLCGWFACAAWFAVMKHMESGT